MCGEDGAEMLQNNRLSKVKRRQEPLSLSVLGLRLSQIRDGTLRLKWLWISLCDACMIVRRHIYSAVYKALYVLRSLQIRVRQACWLMPCSLMKQTFSSFHLPELRAILSLKHIFKIVFPQSKKKRKKTLSLMKGEDIRLVYFKHCYSCLIRFAIIMIQLRLRSTFKWPLQP